MLGHLFGECFVHEGKLESLWKKEQYPLEAMDVESPGPALDSEEL